MKELVNVSRRKLIIALGGSVLGIATLAGFDWFANLTSRKMSGTTGTSNTTAPTQHDSATQTTEFRVETFLENLTIPWSLAFAPDGRGFFTERVGRISVVDVRSTVKLFADVGVAAVGEGGLLGLALSPEFESDHFLYAYHTYRGASGLSNRVVRYREKDGVAVNSTVVFDGIPGGGIHDGGRIRFGPDGKLYIGTGDAGNGQQSQDLQSVAGKILRINPDGSSPPDNPFPNSPVYSYGHRNVQGLDWHPLTKKLYETEHGPTGENGWYANDEVNQIEPGKNFGWPIVKCVANDPRFVDPVYCTGDNETWAPSGCSFYSGGEFPAWRNNLFVATLRGNHLHRFLLDRDSGIVLSHEKLLEGTLGRLRDVVPGPDGMLYVLTSNRDGRGSPAPSDDRILRLTPS